MPHTKQLNELVQERFFPIGLIFLIDIFLTAASFTLSYSICHQFFPGIQSHRLLWQLPIIIAITSLIFLLIGVYKGLVRYDRPKQVYSIFNAICLANILTIFFAVVNGTLFLEENMVIPLSIILVHSFLSFVALGMSRYLYNYIFAYFKNKFVGYHTVVLLHDQMDISADIESMKAFLDENGKKVLRLQKVSGVESETDLQLSNMQNEDAEQFVIWPQTDEVNNVWKILSQIAKFKKPIYLVQNTPKQNADATFHPYNMHQLNLWDLFPSQLHLESSENKVRIGLQAQTILITGAGGSIATEFVERMVDFGVYCQLVLLDNSERALNAISTYCETLDNFKVISKLGDVKDAKFVEKIYKQYHPNLVLHAAGNNRPEFLDNDIDVILRENVIATKQLADFSKKYGAERFVFCSSMEADLPKSTLEVSKRLSEIYMSSLNESSSFTKFVSLRLNKVFDSDSSFVSYLKSQILFGRPISASEYDEYKTFSNKKDVADSILYLLSESRTFASVLQSNLGLTIKTEVLVDLMLSLKKQSALKTIDKTDLLHSGMHTWQLGTFLQPSDNNRFHEPPFREIDVFGKFSRTEIQQKLETLCFNIMLRSGKYDEIFDLLLTLSLGSGKKCTKYMPKVEMKIR